jgi:hypothetical protein
MLESSATFDVSSILDTNKQTENKGYLQLSVKPMFTRLDLSSLLLMGTERAFLLLLFFWALGV